MVGAHWRHGVCAGSGTGDLWQPLPLKISVAAFALSAVLVLSLFSGAAQAAPETIAEYGAGAGQVSFPVGVAINRSTGALYVADTNNFRISKFDAEGNFLVAFGYGVADGVTAALQTCGPEASPPTKFCFASNIPSFRLGAEAVAVDEASGDVYVGDRSGDRVVKFTASGQFLFMVGKNLNKTKAAEGSATQAERNICTAASGDTCGDGE